jgi:hypothetical protein
LSVAKYTKELKEFKERINQDFLFVSFCLKNPGTFGAPTPRIGSQLNDETLSLLESMAKVEKGDKKEVYRLPSHRWLGEVLITRVVGSFEYYISKVLRIMIIKHPKRFENSKVDMIDVIEANDISELIQTFADKKVRELGFKGLKEISNYMEKSFGLTSQVDDLVFRDAVRLVQVRHIIVHNAGRIDKPYLLHSEEDLKVGEFHPFMEGTFLRRGVEAIFKISENYDTQIIDQFKITDTEEMDVRVFSKYNPYENEVEVEGFFL